MAFSIAPALEDHPLGFHLWLLVRASHLPLCTVESPYKLFLSCTRWPCSPKLLGFSTNAYMDKKSLEMKNEELTYQKHPCIPCAFSIVSTVLALGGDFKELFIKTTNKDGML